MIVQLIAYMLVTALLVMIQYPIAVLLHRFVAFGSLGIFLDHFGHEFVEADLWDSAQLGLGRVVQQGFDFGGTEVARVDGDDGQPHFAVRRG